MHFLHVHLHFLDSLLRDENLKGLDATAPFSDGHIGNCYWIPHEPVYNRGPQSPISVTLSPSRVTRGTLWRCPSHNLSDVLPFHQRGFGCVEASNSTRLQFSRASNIFLRLVTSPFSTFWSRIDYKFSIRFKSELPIGHSSRMIRDAPKQAVVL